MTIDFTFQLLALLRESTPILSGAAISEDNVPPAFDQLNNPAKYQPPTIAAARFVYSISIFSAPRTILCGFWPVCVCAQVLVARIDFFVICFVYRWFRLEFDESLAQM